MMTRRNFFLATAASAAVLSRSTNLFAATYDLIIKGGHVIDPSLRINEVRDVAISGGRIAAVARKKLRRVIMVVSSRFFATSEKSRWPVRSRRKAA